MKKRNKRRKLSWTSICSLFEKRNLGEGSKVPQPTVDQETWLGRRSVITDQILGDEKFLTCWKDILIATASPSIDILFCIKTHWGHLSEFWKLFDWLYLISVVLQTFVDRGLSVFVEDRQKEISMLLCFWDRPQILIFWEVWSRGEELEPEAGRLSPNWAKACNSHIRQGSVISD